MRTAYYRAVPPIGAVSAPRYQKKREKKRENLESDATLSISIHRLRAISLLTRSVARSLLPAGDFFSPRREKERGNIPLVTPINLVSPCAFPVCYCLPMGFRDDSFIVYVNYISFFLFHVVLILAIAKVAICRFQQNMETYRNLITQSMYDKQLDSGRGTLLHLCDDVIQQEVGHHTELSDQPCNNIEKVLLSMTFSPLFHLTKFFICAGQRGYSFLFYSDGARKGHNGGPD
ncbi:hypothetical protein B296_00005065 [Ensete ventricosum]|uniref:Uncharacterized protein n=1 Tax=Ensete ventricosum TaxID=4639 RepID=A0A427ADJ5_ENSVE|nr:hypothetical protein B296_00005065 [Ensete ventricosum]